MRQEGKGRPLPAMSSGNKPCLIHVVKSKREKNERLKEWYGIIIVIRMANKLDEEMKWNHQSTPQH